TIKGLLPLNCGNNRYINFFQGVLPKMIFLIYCLLVVFLISFGVYFLINILQILRQRNSIRQQGNEELIKVLKEISNALNKKE
ncbi:hypothetical protein, partial [Brevibacillus laterosporus]|uniref:hypothetical protein n=1 Tax=Brevibacillus laterosporus TaxID=1465 RepID=UPI001F3B8FB1